MTSRLEPKLITVLKEGYSRKQLLNDLVAGLVVGMVALPLAIALAIASGVKPEQGLYTAIIGGFVIAALGGSRVQVSGPTAAFIVVVYGIVQKNGYEGLAMATFLAGLMLMAAGFLRMGVLLKFIPYPLTIGFTSGIAVIIFSSQVRDLFGLEIRNLPAGFVDQWGMYASNFFSFNPWSLGVGIVSLLLLFLLPYLNVKIPGSLVVLIGVTCLVQILGLDVETIGSRFGEVPHTLPMPHFIALNWDLISKAFSPALTIAILGAIESLLSATVADGILGTRHRPNTELIAQGIGNILSPLFLGIPATGAIARTATNIKSGGRSPIAAMTHAVVLLLVMLFFGKWAALIPMPALAAILVYVAFHMSEYRTFVRMFRSPKSDVAIMLTTFFLTVLIDLTVAIEVGVILSAFLFLKRMEDVTEVTLVTETLHHDRDDSEILVPGITEVPDGVEVFSLDGPLFFGAVDRFKNAMKRVQRSYKTLILRMRNVPAIDATGIHALHDLIMQMKRENASLILSGVRPQPRRALQRAGLMEILGEDNVCDHIDEALARAREIT